MTKMTEVAYGAAVKAIFDQCNRENKINVIWHRHSRVSLLIGQVLKLLA